MSEPLDPRERGTILWHGRPEVGVRAQDLLAGLLTAAAGTAVTAFGLALQNAWAWEWAARLGAGYGALVGIVVCLGRPAGAGRWLTTATAFCTVLCAAALWTGRQGLELVCPLASSGFFFGLVGLRWRQRQATRYQVTAQRGLRGELGRYVISFPLDPAGLSVRPDRLGPSLGTVRFGQVESTLTTRDGKVFSMPSQMRAFERVLHPERLLEALEAADPA